MSVLFSDPHIRIAGQPDIHSIVQLLNSAYRGESSRKGWTTEADLIAGDVRTDEQNVSSIMAQTGSVFLVYQKENSIRACVNLQILDDRVYLGMFSVNPEEQGNGIGKKMLLAAEEWTSAQQRKTIYMSVITARTELIAWYQRHGYSDTGHRKPFVEDGLTGKHLRQLEFMILEKYL